MVSSFKKTPPWYRYEPRVLSYAIEKKGISGRNRLFRHSPAVPLHIASEYGRGSPSSPCGVVRKYHYPPCVSSRPPCQGQVNELRLSLRLLPSSRRSICRLLIRAARIMYLKYPVCRCQRSREENVLLLFVTFWGQIGVCRIKKDSFCFAVCEVPAEPIF